MLDEENLSRAINKIAVDCHIDVRGWSVPRIVSLLEYIHEASTTTGDAVNDWFARTSVPGSAKTIIHK